MNQRWESLQRRARQHPSDPVVTWYSPTGERAELSAVTFTTAVAKLAWWLQDDCELAPDDPVRLLLPLHWQLPVWLAACDVAGVQVDWRAGADPVALVVAADPDTALAHPAPWQVVAPCTAFGLPLPPAGLPHPVIDAARAAQAQPDAYPGIAESGSWRLPDGRLYLLTSDAEGPAAPPAADSPGRLLLSTGAHRPPNATWLWPGLSQPGRSVVLAAGVDTREADRIAAVEAATPVAATPEP